MIGERLEKESELETLPELGITTAQGYYLGVPRPAGETAPDDARLRVGQGRQRA